MNRGQQQQRPPTLPQVPSNMQYSRAGGPGYPAVNYGIPPRGTMQQQPQSYSAMPSRATHGMVPSTPGYLQGRNTGTYFGAPTSGMNLPGMQPSPNPSIPSLQQPGQSSLAIHQQHAAQQQALHLGSASTQLTGTSSNSSDNVIDQSEFPPLGSTPQSSSVGGGGASAASASFHSTYASQAGTAVANGAGVAVTAGGQSTAQHTQADQHRTMLPGGQLRAMSELEKRNFAKLAPSSQGPWSTQPGAAQVFPSALSNGQHLGAPPNLPAPSYNGQQQTAFASQQPQQQPQPQSQATDRQAQQILLSAADRWGLLGLLASIKGTDPDSQLLGSGTDLAQIGLDLATSGHLSSTFVTPWADANAAAAVEPEFHLPACYNVQAPAPGPQKVGSFSDETLFFMFYSSPRDTLQEVAAQELYNRNWRYHKEVRLWLTKETGQSPLQKDAAGERGTYTFFDPEQWAKVKKEAVIYYEQLEERALPQSLTAMNMNLAGMPMMLGGMGQPQVAMRGIGA